MITVVVPTLNSAETLPRTLEALVPAAVDGLVRSLVVADGGSVDETLAIAEEAGARIVRSGRGRGRQLAAGGRAAKGEWLLFLHSDTVPEPGFEAEVARFCCGAGPFEGYPSDRAAAFRFALDDGSLAAGMVGLAVRTRWALFGLAYGDQGLLIPRAFYERLGGFRDMPLMEDVDIVRRIGRSRMTLLAARAVTSARRYRRDGYARRVARNALCLGLYFLGVPPRRIVRLYG